MDYANILNDIKPTEDEMERLNEISHTLINFLNKTCMEESIDAKITLVGSVAKGTALKGKSDIDIFMAFPLDTDKQYLKEIGLYLAHKCSDNFDGEASHHFASHPYVTSIIDGFEVDFVPCYEIEDGSQLKSAVDRTILHTRYVMANLSDEQRDEVLLLKRFMDMTGTYGSEFKVGGFAGYLCELLVIYYGNFENTLKNATKWQFGQEIDLMDYGTAGQFKDPLIVIDPTDKNRNVGAALRLEKMGEFIQSARNYLSSQKKEEYFYPASKPLDRQSIIDAFEDRGSELMVIRFDIPDIPLDTLHPQLKKTTESLERKMVDEEFNVFNADYWSDEKSDAVIVFEMASSTLNSVRVHTGPKVFINQACENFTKKYGRDNCYIIDDFLVSTQKREFVNAHNLIEHVFTEEHIGLIKVGKNLKNNIINTYEFISIEDLMDSEGYLEFLNDFLNPASNMVR